MPPPTRRSFGANCRGRSVPLSPTASIAESSHPILSAAQAGASRAGLKSEFVWLAAGRLAPAKDYPHLLRAFAQVHAAAPEARLWIAGRGNNHYTSHLHTLAAQLGLGASICWLGLRREIPELLDLADGFVLASAWEGMPLALGEAMAMEKTIVATDVGGVRELAGECAAIVRTGKPALLAAAMLQRMRLEPEIRMAQGRAARNRILRLFPMETSADRWEELYRRIAEHGDSPT